ncbi:MAG: O-antigen ligase family protein [Clostridia bacterium]|nr:O-antigen ligase family protein [Clostridia bacterium]
MGQVKNKQFSLNQILFFVAVVATAALLMLSLLNRQGGVMYYALFVLIVPVVFVDDKTFAKILMFWIPFNTVLYISSFSIIIVFATFRVVKDLINTKNKKIDSLIPVLFAFLIYSLFTRYSDAVMDSIKNAIIILLSLKLFDSLKEEDEDGSAFGDMIVSFSCGVILTVVGSIAVNGIDFSSRFSVTGSSGVNALGIMSATCIIYLAMLISQTDKDRPLRTVLVLLLLTTGFLTQSRTFLLMIVIAALWMTLFEIGSRKNMLRNTIIVVIVLITVYILFTRVPFMADLLDKMMNRVDKLDSDSGGGRYILWQKYLETIFSTPKTILFGIGDYKNYGIMQVAHNMWIEIIAEYGFLGLPVAILVYVHSLRRILSSGERYKIRLFSFLPMIIFFVAMMYSHTPIGNPNTVVFLLSGYAVYAFSKGFAPREKKQKMTLSDYE